jgi:hypothetical protein
MECFEDKRPLEIKKTGNMNFYLNTHMERGDLSLEIISPDNREVVYSINGMNIKDRGSISVTPVTWIIKLTVENGVQGRINLRSMVN